jgi:hypothetical protein
MEQESNKASDSRKSDFAQPSRGPTARGEMGDALRGPLAPGYFGRRSRPIVAILALMAILLLGLLWWFDPSQMNLPLCRFHALMGLNCPGCGATRATHELLHGRLAAAWHYNALWVLSLPLAVYASISELRTLAGGRPLPGGLSRRIWFWISLSAAGMVFFVVRNLT